MASIIEHEWIAVNDDEQVVARADTEEALERELRRQCRAPGLYDLVAVPKRHKSMFV